MAVDALSSRRLGRGFAIAIVLMMSLSLGLVLAAPARAAFTGAQVVLTPGLYTNDYIYVPGETITVTAYATGGDVLDFRFWNTAGTPYSDVTGQTVGSSGTLEVTFQVPLNWADGPNYAVRVTDTTSAEVVSVAFAIKTYNLRVFTTRTAYLLGDSVNVTWAATLIKDGSPAPPGVGNIQVWDAGANLLPAPGNYSITASTGYFGFRIPTTTPVRTNAVVFAYFNDTAVPPLRPNFNVAGFRVGTLREALTLDAATYAPGGVVTATAVTRVQQFVIPNINDPPEPGVIVNFTVRDSTGAPVTAYGARNLTTDARGTVVHVFQLSATPTSGTYQVSAAATANGIMSVTPPPVPFDVVPTPVITASLVLNKAQFLSGDTITGTASASPSASYVYSWEVLDVTQTPHFTLAVSSGTATTFSYTTSPTFRGTIEFSVYADDGQGHTSATVTQTATVDYGYLSLSVDKAEFNPGDTVTASYSLIHGSAVLTSPTYFYTVTDDAGNTVAAGNLAGTTVSYTTPNPAANYYTFTVTASQDGRSVSAAVATFQVGGYLMSISLDKSSYNPGDTMHITYQITARGRSVLPLQFRVTAWLIGAASSSSTTTSAAGTVTLVVPQGTSSGDLVLQVFDASTGAGVDQIVHVGPVNPLLADVGGLPAVDWLLMLLVIVLILVVVLLWRRTGMGPGPKPLAEPKGAATPPPPPTGPQPPQAAGPMSVTCGHCGKPIEITTSKRPIEVMCPSCGETQVVQ